MSRKKLIKKTLFNKDFKFNSILVTLLINRILKNGKKNIAKKIVYKAFTYIYNKTKENPLLIFEKAIRNISPVIKLKNVYKKGNVLKIPVLINSFDSTIQAISWLIKIAKKKSKKQMYLKLGNEILDAFKGIGNTIKKKEEVHKTAKANKTYLFKN